jgi:hypothetical protein
MSTVSGAEITHNNAETLFVEAAGVEFAYRRRRGRSAHSRAHGRHRLAYDPRLN